MPQILPSQWTAATPEDTTLAIIGQSFGHHTPRKAYSFKSTDDNEMRFELRKGERYQGMWADATAERCEVGQNVRIPVGILTAVSFKLLIEPGGKFTSPWLTMGQLHSAMNASPPLSLVFRGSDKMKFLAIGNAGEKEIWTDPLDVTRGKWYAITMATTFNGGATPKTTIIRDGVKLVEYAGQIGYAGQPATYWKQGIYRATPPGGETIITRFKGLKIATGATAQDMIAAALAAIPTPAPTPTPTPTPTPVPTVGKYDALLKERADFDAAWIAKLKALP